MHRPPSHNGFTLASVSLSVGYRFPRGRAVGTGPQVICDDPTGTKHIVYWRLADRWHIVTDPITTADLEAWNGLGGTAREVTGPMGTWLDKMVQEAANG